MERLYNLYYGLFHGYKYKLVAYDKADFCA